MQAHFIQIPAHVPGTISDHKWRILFSAIYIACKKRLVLTELYVLLRFFLSVGNLNNTVCIVWLGHKANDHGNLTWHSKAQYKWPHSSSKHSRYQSEVMTDSLIEICVFVPSAKASPVWWYRADGTQCTEFRGWEDHVVFIYCKGKTNSLNAISLIN